MKILLIIAATATLLIAGCEGNPDDRTLLDGPRLLSVRSTPPMLQGFDGSISLDALALRAGGQVMAQSSVEFRVCSPWTFLIDPERDCPASSSLIPTDAKLSTQQLLAFYPPPDWVADGVVGDGIVADESPATPACAGDAAIEVPVLAEVNVDGVSLQTVKRIPIYLDETAKRNPQLEPIRITREEDGVHTMSIAVNPRSLDAECRNDVLGLEAVRVYVYSTSGSFEESSVDILSSLAGEATSAELEWTSAGEPALLVFVAVDNDGGVDWRTLSL